MYKNLHDLERVFLVASVLYRSCTAPQNGRLGSDLSDIDHDLDDQFDLDHDLD